MQNISIFSDDNEHGFSQIKKSVSGYILDSGDTRTNQYKKAIAADAMILYEFNLSKDLIVGNPVQRKLTLDNDTFENTGKSRFFERRTSRVLY